VRTIFLDTVGLLAIWDSDDQWHAAATRAIDELGSSIVTVTTNYVMIECGNASARRPYRRQVDQMRRTLQAGNKLIVPTDDDLEIAWRAYTEGHSSDAGIVDHISFVIMRRLNIADVFTNDRHFKAAGFNTLF
jgi:predicted nucleic acid-binding protein